MLEVEVKVKVDDFGPVEEQLQKLAFARSAPIIEEDVYFNSDRYDLKEADKALRIRMHKFPETGKSDFILNYKGPKKDDTTMTRQETQFKVPGYDVTRELLEGLGYKPASKVIKTRVHYTNGDVTCCLDDVTWLGKFLEIEIMTDEQGYDDAVSRIRNLLDVLGFKMEDTIRQSYLTMVMGVREK